MPYPAIFFFWGGEGVGGASFLISIVRRKPIVQLVVGGAVSPSRCSPGGKAPESFGYFAFE